MTSSIVIVTLIFPNLTLFPISELTTSGGVAEGEELESLAGGWVEGVVESSCFFNSFFMVLGVGFSGWRL